MARVRCRAPAPVLPRDQRRTARSGGFHRRLVTISRFGRPATWPPRPEGPVMKAMQDADLIGEYIGRLYAAASVLPLDRRHELISEISEHIEMALEQAGSRDEVTVRTVLDRLGE